MGSRRSLTSAIVLVGIALPSIAAAAPSGGARFIVGVDGACHEHEATADVLEREIGLACAAVGGTCRVVATRQEAELEARLSCGKDAWSLEISTIEGSVLTKIVLDGPREDRLREAAVEIARDEAPERALVIDDLRDALPGNDENHHKKPAAPVFSLAVGGRGSLTVEGSAPLGGAHLLAGLRVSRLVSWVTSGAFEAGGSGDHARQNLRVGTGVGFGAPFVEGPFGVMFEAGAAVDEGHHDDASRAWSPLTTSRSPSVGAFVQGTFLVQVPRGPVRPYAGISTCALSIAPTVIASGELGVAFSVF